jgi:peptidyl-prolyl cis-trans isomerase A (cyclophilin A)
MHQDSALPPNYTIFGQAVAGLDVVDKIAEAATKSGGEGSSPVTPVKIVTMTIEEK